MSSTTLTIDIVCEDVLRLIFDKYLDLRSQLNLQMVCKRFNQLIQQIFDGKRALYLTDDSKQLNDIFNESLDKYSVLSVQPFCNLREGLWVRGQRGLRLLQPFDIQMYALRKHRNLKSLCLVMNSRYPMDKLLDQIMQFCSSYLEKLIIININGTKLTINYRQMQDLCRQYSKLLHFELFSDYLYATEECFQYLLSNSQSLEVFKLNVRHIFSETIESLNTNSRSVTYNSYTFNGSLFSKTSGQLTTIDVSHPIMTNAMLVDYLDKSLNNSLFNVKHLGVERLLPNGMQAICRSFSGLESLSFSMNDDLDLNNTKTLINSISQLRGLQKLTIRWFGRYLIPMGVAIDVYTISGLKECQNLKYLAIKEAIINENSLKAIIKYIPSLESLRFVDCTLNRSTFNPINGLRNLKELVIMRSFPNQNYLKFDINPLDEHISDKITLDCIEAQLIEGLKRKNDTQEEVPQELQVFEVVVDQLMNEVYENIVGDEIDLGLNLYNYSMPFGYLDLAIDSVNPFNQ